MSDRIINKYLIKKSAGFGYEHKLVANVSIDEKGKLLYNMVVEDEGVENLLLKAQKEGGLYMLIPFSDNENIRGIKEQFVRINDTEHFIDALEFNLKDGLVDKT